MLEPSTQGFLSIIEKSFPRSDLYLFELLQNAVDDGASSVTFRVHDARRSSASSSSLSSASASISGSGLAFHHNGREFTPLDVLGLASVGLSTKTGRTIGFMGVGFKAVYVRIQFFFHMRAHSCKRNSKTDIALTQSNCLLVVRLTYAILICNLVVVWNVEWTIKTFKQS